MTENVIGYQQAEVTITGESLKKFLEAGSVRQIMSFKVKICESLREAYENTMWSECYVDLEIPGGATKSPSQKGIDDPRQPGDEIDDEYSHINIVVIHQENPRKLALLNEALRWGCK